MGLYAVELLLVAVALSTQALPQPMTQFDRGVTADHAVSLLAKQVIGRVADQGSFVRRQWIHLGARIIYLAPFDVEWAEAARAPYHKEMLRVAR